MTLRRADFGDVVAEDVYTFEHLDGQSHTVHFKIGRPYRVDDKEWACPCCLEGFEPRYPDVRGVSSLQALSLAAALLRQRTEAFVSTGGRVIDDFGHDVDVRAVFGMLTTNDPGAPRLA